MATIKKAYMALLAAAIPAAAMAQSAIDAAQISQPDFKGTARFMAMGGAFTALGGDLSTLNQNPAGIGIYRSSEVGATLDIDMQKTATSPSYSPAFPSNSSQTKVYCNNFGYIGSVQLDGAMRTFNWGVSYNRAASFDRTYRGYVGTLQNSLSNYVAAFSSANSNGFQGYSPSQLEFTNSFNPYLDNSSNVDWLSILSYNSYLINPVGNNTYSGLFKATTQGNAQYYVRETGYVDEYDISFGGNVENVVYWGLSIGVTDLNYTRYLNYNEELTDAEVLMSKDATRTTNGGAYFDLISPKYINGTGWNLKFGLIFKPINEFRIGLAVHTPTWYRLTQGYNGDIYSKFTPQNGTAWGTFTPTDAAASEYTDEAYFNWHFNAPWRFMAGMAGVIGGKAIVSMDYQFDGYNSMNASTPTYVSYGQGSQFEPDDVINGDVKTYFKGANTLRLGLEYRVTPQFSVRAGYNYKWSYVKDQAANGLTEVFTSGTDPSYSFDQNTYHVTAGLGYRYKSWYIDATYVYKHRESTFHAFTNYGPYVAPQSAIADNNSSIVFSTGFKF